VVTIDANGNITAVDAGSTTIYATKKMVIFLQAVMSR